VYEVLPGEFFADLHSLELTENVNVNWSEENERIGYPDAEMTLILRDSNVTWSE
jgi:hypothetical protein